MNKIDFAALKSGVSIDAVLAHYGIQTKKRNSQYLVAPCPLPTHSSKDSAFSFAVNVEKNLWTCHSDSCKKASGLKGGDVIDLVCLMEGTRLPLEGAKKLMEWFPQNQNAPREAERNGDSLPANHTAVVEKNKPLAFTLKDIAAAHPMIQSRGISEETAKSFGVGYFLGKGSMAGRIVFPLHEDGELIGYAGRLVDNQLTNEKSGVDNPRWKLPPIHKSFLYGLERCDPAKLLILTESFWAPLYFHQRGAQCASLMGKSLTEAQEQRLQPFKTICVAMDNDEAGKEAAEKIVAKLRNGRKVSKAFLMEG